jgi:hypothetical protein
MRFINRFAWRVLGSGARHTRTIGRSIVRIIQSKWNKIAENNACGTKSGV